jgi:hypothetical protein
MESVAVAPFSLTHGGPFYRSLRRLHLQLDSGRARFGWLAILAWLPLAIGAVVHRAQGWPPDPMLSDLSVHVRILITLPILLYAEHLLESTAASAMKSVYVADMAPRTDIDRIVTRAYRLRDAWQAEALLVAVALLGGQLVLWRIFGSTGLFHGGHGTATLTFPRVWYVVVALPLVHFVMMRWLWRWLIWSYIVIALSRLPLSLLATHPDHACGLAGLARPMTGCSGFVLGISAILASAWGTQVLHGRATLPGLLPMLAAFLIAALVLAIAALLFLSPHLFRTRRRTLAEYGDFARHYVLGFHAKWLAGGAIEGERALGSQDIQSLNDLGQAYEVASKTRIFVFGPRNVLVLWAAGLMPMVPLFASALTVEQILKRIVSTVLGGFPF